MMGGVSYRRMPDGTQVSLLGFGCMRLPRLYEDRQDIDAKAAQEMIDYAIAQGINYFDTAWPYHQGMSEPFLGEALSKHPRDSFFLASKLPTWDINCAEDVDRIFNQQLERCRVDHFDFYLIHNFVAEYFEREENCRIYQKLLKKKRAGQIRYLGFSFHDVPKVLEQVADKYAWDFAQIQLNYLDWELQNAKRQYEILESRSIPVIVMEPVRGGALASLSEPALKLLHEANPEQSPASWALRFAASFPGVLTVLSGMSDFAQVKENIQTMSAPSPLTEADRELLERVCTAYLSAGTIPCTGCRYCMDCPAGVDIPKVFAIYNQYCIFHQQLAFERTYGYLTDRQKASACVDCKSCVPRCPQGIDIPARLREVADAIANLPQD